MQILNVDCHDHDREKDSGHDKLHQSCNHCKFLNFITRIPSSGTGFKLITLTHNILYQQCGKNQA